MKTTEIIEKLEKFEQLVRLQNRNNIFIHIFVAATYVLIFAFGVSESFDPFLYFALLCVLLLLIVSFSLWNFYVTWKIAFK